MRKCRLISGFSHDVGIRADISSLSWSLCSFPHIAFDWSLNVHMTSLTPVVIHNGCVFYCNGFSLGWERQMGQKRM